MRKTVAYVRVSTDKQELENQRFEIERFAKLRGYEVDEWYEEVISGTIALKDRKVGDVLGQLRSGDTLIISEISRLSRSIERVLTALRECIERDVTVVSVKENMVFGNDLNSKIVAVAFGLAAEIERNLISARTKEALARKKAEGVVLGRPIGSSKPEFLKLNGKDSKILRLLDKRVSLAAIARLLEVNRKTLVSYIQRQNLMEQHRYNQFKKLDN